MFPSHWHAVSLTQYIPATEGKGQWNDSAGRHQALKAVQA
ncbi:hypothetical protein ACPOL_6450 [Acidisarcina polymorpha]|uniref:Uncharacterized protein n=1 Tax=Acidisarcina polymorpha TaxID=2211140 RepID=A0A2Z5G9K7_9BACT|nr:hypothetical protein ACPOL_6450 [Acidisarcina polymorpha]